MEGVARRTSKLIQGSKVKKAVEEESDEEQAESDDVS
jgi:hypothetical protein